MVGRSCFRAEKDDMSDTNGNGAIDENGYISPARVTLAGFLLAAVGFAFAHGNDTLRAVNVAPLSQHKQDMKSIESRMDSIRDAQRRQSSTLDRLECFAQAEAESRKPTECWR